MDKKQVMRKEQMVGGAQPHWEVPVAAEREGVEIDTHFGIYQHLLSIAQNKGFRSVSAALDCALGAHDLTDAAPLGSAAATQAAVPADRNAVLEEALHAVGSLECSDSDHKHLMRAFKAIEALKSVSAPDGGERKETGE